MSQDLDTLAHIGILVADHAADIFAACGAPDDFCIQTVGAVAVFGKTNRIRWSPSNGFQPDPAYCTPAFLAAFRNLKEPTP